MNLPKEERAKRENWTTLCTFYDEDLDEETFDSTLHQILERIVSDFLVLNEGEWNPWSRFPFEMKLISTLGIECFDSSTGEMFKLRARLGLIIGDLPEMADLLEKVYPTGLNACHVCAESFDCWANFSVPNAPVFFLWFFFYIIIIMV